MPVYLIHFDFAYKHARHYLGFAEVLDHRIAEQLSGGSRAARLLQVVSAAGIGYKIVRTWEGGRDIERLLKRQKDSDSLCPICNPSSWKKRKP